MHEPGTSPTITCPLGREKIKVAGWSSSSQVNLALGRRILEESVLS
jgi:hypothetical protein